MLDVILIICLVVIDVAWIVSNDWDCLMCLWKNHALFLLYGGILLWYSPLMLYLGWLGACSHHVWLQTSHLKTLWSFGFWLVISLYALVNNVLSLCMITAVIALLVGRSQPFASLHLYWQGILLVHSTPKNQSFPMCPPYLPISNFLFQVYSSCFYLSSKLNFLLCENLLVKLSRTWRHIYFLALNEVEHCGSLMLIICL
jgi:hypothetical protein